MVIHQLYCWDLQVEKQPFRIGKTCVQYDHIMTFHIPDFHWSACTLSLYNKLVTGDLGKHCSLIYQHKLCSVQSDYLNTKSGFIGQSPKWTIN